MFIEYLFTDFQFFFWWILIMVFSVCVHELAHAVAAYEEGDDTAKERGYFTLNPMVHMGTASLLLLLFVGICWGACPVNPSKLKRSCSNALVSLAGPLANFLLMMVFVFLAVLLPTLATALSETAAYNLLRFFHMGARLNAALFLLNMLPLPPLDGHAVWEFIFPALKPVYAQIGAGGFVLIMMLFWLPIGFNEFFWDMADGMATAFYGAFSILI